MKKCKYRQPFSKLLVSICLLWSNTVSLSSCYSVNETVKLRKTRLFLKFMHDLKGIQVLSWILL